MYICPENKQVLCFGNEDPVTSLKNLHPYAWGQGGGSKYMRHLTSTSNLYTLLSHDYTQTTISKETQVVATYFSKQ